MLKEFGGVGHSLSLRESSTGMGKWTIAFVLVICFACKPNGKEDTADDLLADMIPQEVILGDSVQLPVYDFDGLEPLLKQKDSMTYVINFWATWCKPCVMELPHFEKLARETKGSNVKVILVDLDLPDSWESQVIPFLQKHQIQNKVVALDDPKQNTWIPKVDPSWSGGIPATLIYNKDKRNFYEQSFDYDGLKGSVDQFIQK